jgi:hypothetical protein
VVVPWLLLLLLLRLLVGLLLLVVLGVHRCCGWVLQLACALMLVHFTVWGCGTDQSCKPAAVTTAS